MTGVLQVYTCLLPVPIMETSIKKLPKSQIELKIEVSAKDFNDFIDKAILNLGKDLEIKGFRKGMAPKEVIEREVGLEKILIEAADLAVKENYRKAILENKIEAIFQPRIEIQKLARGDSFIFLAKITVLPEIKLPDYKKIASKIKRMEIKVGEKEVDDALFWFQKSRAKLTLKNQPAQKGDFVEIEYQSPELEVLLTPREQKDAFILGESHFIPGFEEQLIGMKAKEEKEFSITIPEKHPLRKYGREVSFKVKMISVQNVELPEINDQFVKSLGKFENLASLKNNIKEGLTLEKKQIESQRLRNEILEEINKDTAIEIPELLVTEEKKQMLENFKKSVIENLKISFTDYLNKIKKTEEEMLDYFLPQAQKRIKNSLILKEIGKREKIEVSEEEIVEEVSKILKDTNIDPENLKEYTEEVIRTEKIFQLLESFSSLSKTI